MMVADSAAIAKLSCRTRIIEGLFVASVGFARSSEEHRGVAQLGSAPALGAGCRRFKSGRPDHADGSWPAMASLVVAVALGDGAIISIDAQR